MEVRYVYTPIPAYVHRLFIGGGIEPGGRQADPSMVVWYGKNPESVIVISSVTCDMT